MQYEGEKMQKEKVNQWIAIILSKLYEKFPERVYLCPQEIDPDANKQQQKQIYELIKWLEEEGIIRSSATDLANCFHETTLTLKGLTILSSVPDNLKEKRKFGDFLTTVVKEGSINAINQIVQDLFQLLLKG